VLISNLAFWLFVKKAKVVEVKQKARLEVKAELNVNKIKDEYVSSIRRC
jgi:hypothetical protein